MQRHPASRGGAHRPDLTTRRRVTQETIDEMAPLRRQGLTFKEIGARVGCSERTARRYVANVQPQLHLPQATPELETDPRVLREELLSEFIDILYRDTRLRSLTLTWHRVDENSHRAEYGGPPSILFLNEAERLLGERLESIGDLALSYLARDMRSKRRFMREVVGFLYTDYVGWHEFAQNIGFCETGEDWRPPSERPPCQEVDENDIEEPFAFGG